MDCKQNMNTYKEEDMRRGEVHSIIANATLAKQHASTLFCFLRSATKLRGLCA